MFNSKGSFCTCVIAAVILAGTRAIAGQIPVPVNMSYSIDQSPPLLGTAYNSKTKNTLGACVEGEGGTIATNPQSNLHTSISSDYQEVTKSLGLEVGGRFRYGVVEASASAKFARSSVDTGYCTSSI